MSVCRDIEAVGVACQLTVVPRVDTADRTVKLYGEEYFYAVGASPQAAHSSEFAGESVVIHPFDFWVDHGSRTYIAAEI